MGGQFICFFDRGTTGDPEKDRVPIAIGETRDAALAIGLPRMLQMVAGDFWAMQYGSVATVAQPDLSAADFRSVGETIDQFFANLPAASPDIPPTGRLNPRAFEACAGQGEVL